MYVGSGLKRAWKSGRRHLKSLPSSRTGENPPYGLIGGVEETSASFEARSAPRSYPTALTTSLFCGQIDPASDIAMAMVLLIVVFGSIHRQRYNFVHAG